MDRAVRQKDMELSMVLDTLEEVSYPMAKAGGLRKALAD